MKENEIRKSVYGNEENKDLKNCGQELEKMAKDAQLKFAKEDDRKTIANAFEANQNICKEERKAGIDEFIKERDELEKEIEQLKQKLKR